MKKLESLNNEKFAALQSSEIGNLAAVVGGLEKDTIGAGGSADCATFFESSDGSMDVKTTGIAPTGTGTRK